METTKNYIIKLLATLGPCVLGISVAFAQEDIVSFNSTTEGNTVINLNSFTIGYEFDVTTPITVTGLSVFSGSVVNAYAPVGLWNASGTELALESILTGDAAPLTTDRFFRYKLLSTPITLPDGIYYVGAYIQGANSGENVPYTYNVNGLGSISGVTYISPQAIGGTSLALPSESVGSLFSAGVFGGDVVVAPTAVPEPEICFLLSMGLSGLIAFGRKKSNTTCVDRR